MFNSCRGRQWLAARAKLVFDGVATPLEWRVDNDGEQHEQHCIQQNWSPNKFKAKISDRAAADNCSQCSATTWRVHVAKAHHQPSMHTNGDANCECRVVKNLC